MGRGKGRREEERGEKAAAANCFALLLPPLHPFITTNTFAPGLLLRPFLEKEAISQTKNILRAWVGKSIKEFNSAKIRSLAAQCLRQLTQKELFESLSKKAPECERWCVHTHTHTISPAQ